MNIYVSNLGFNIKDEDLKRIFSSFGTVTSAKVINDRETNKSRGFGFVEMPDKSEAMAAMGQLNETTVDGRVIKVVEAKPREDRSSGGFQSGGFSSNKKDYKNRW